MTTPTDETSAEARDAAGTPRRTASVGHGTAHGKIILLGEHLAVHGGAAIVIPMPTMELRATARRTAGVQRLDSALYAGKFAKAPTQLGPAVTAFTAALEAVGDPRGGANVTIEGELPHGRGLGSSAASAGAIIASIFDLYDRELDADTRFELVQRAERVAHGRPSGLDARGTSATGPIHFQRGRVRQLESKLNASIVVADSGVPGSTRESVAAVTALLERLPVFGGMLLQRIHEQVERTPELMRIGDAAAIGDAMTIVHAALAQLGVSDDALDAMQLAMLGNGALGAKLTGGGRGGCVIALTKHEDVTRVAKAAIAAGAARTWTVDLGAFTA